MATILVVDDEPTILETVAGMLAEEGHAVLTATDGLAAREVLEGTMPDLVVTDTMMPRLDGPGLVRWMRSRPDLSHIHVVLTSAAAPPLLAGLEPISFVAKPFSLDSLLGAIGQALD